MLVLGPSARSSLPPRSRRPLTTRRRVLGRRCQARRARRRSPGNKGSVSDRCAYAGESPVSFGARAAAWQRAEAVGAACFCVSTAAGTLGARRSCNASGHRGWRLSRRVSCARARRVCARASGRRPPSVRRAASWDAPSRGRAVAPRVARADRRYAVVRPDAGARVRPAARRARLPGTVRWTASARRSGRCRCTARARSLAVRKANRRSSGRSGGSFRDTASRGRRQCLRVGRRAAA
jgi:hypothetical protein